MDNSRGKESKIGKLEKVLGMPVKKYLAQKYNHEGKSDHVIAREIIRAYHYSISSTAIRKYRIKNNIKSKEKPYRGCYNVG